MKRSKAIVQLANQVVPGEHITRACEGRLLGRWCCWFPTKLCGKRWLCSECEKVYLNRLMVRRVKDKLRRQRKRVT